MKVQTESFHSNGYIIGFRLQTQKLELPYKTWSRTLVVKGLITNWSDFKSRSRNDSVGEIRYKRKKKAKVKVRIAITFFFLGVW